MNIAYVIDFGLLKQFRSPDTHQHITLHSGCGLTGTSLFASNNSHAGLELARRDDLESLAYILIYFLCGGLPWEDLGNNALIAQWKLDYSAEELCCGFPTKFATLLNYSQSLPFEDKPDYNHLIGLFDHLIQHVGVQNDTVFNWDIVGQLNTLCIKPIPVSCRHKSHTTSVCRTGLIH